MHATLFTPRLHDEVCARFDGPIAGTLSEQNPASQTIHALARIGPIFDSTQHAVSPMISGPGLTPKTISTNDPMLRCFGS